MGKRKINDAEMLVFQKEMNWLKESKEIEVQRFIENMQIINRNIEELAVIVSNGEIEEME